MAFGVLGSTAGLWAPAQANWLPGAALPVEASPDETYSWSQHYKLSETRSIKSRDASSSVGNILAWPPRACSGKTTAKIAGSGGARFERSSFCPSAALRTPPSPRIRVLPEMLKLLQSLAILGSAAALAPARGSARHAIARIILIITRSRRHIRPRVSCYRHISRRADARAEI